MALVRELAPQLPKLPRERVWQEVHYAMISPSPRQFVVAFRNSGALAHLIPELDCLFGVPQPLEYHPEIDTGEHMLLALKAAATLTAEPQAGFAVLLHDLGKGLTPPGMLPQHVDHEKNGGAIGLRGPHFVPARSLSRAAHSITAKGTSGKTPTTGVRRRISENSDIKKDLGC